MNPATPGFIVTLGATILLALVSFSTPIIKSIDFIQATFSDAGVNATITLGTLGYCIDLSTNGTTCSKASVGYEFDPNALLGDNISFAQIPTVFVKWITYALFLHVIALCGAAISALFGLLAHVREMSMACCSTCISGFTAFITLVAFIFDIVLFFIVKERVKSNDGSAAFGSAIWLTLAAWLLLFFSGCAFACGRCCRGRRDRAYAGNDTRDGRMDTSWMGRFDPSRNRDNYQEQMRLDAVRAEAERKQRQARGEIGLPAFPGADATQPLSKGDADSDDEPGPMPGAMGPRRQGSAANYAGGYAQAAPGSRAVDEYYAPARSPAPQSNSSVNTNTGYPPNRSYAPSVATSAGRQPTVTSGASSVYSGYAPTMPGGPGAGVAAGVAAGAAAGAGAAAYLAPGRGAGQHQQYASGQQYGHAAGGTSYHTAASQHGQYPSAYSQYDNKTNPNNNNNAGAGGFSADSYNALGTMVPTSLAAGQAQRQASPPTQAGAYGSPYTSNANANTGGHPQDRSYTLGGGGYDSYGYSDPYAANNTNTTAMPMPGGVATAITTDMPSPGRAPNVGGYSPSPPPSRLVASPPPMMSSSVMPAEKQMPMPGVGASSSQYGVGAGGHGGGGHSGMGSVHYEDSPPVYDAGPNGPGVPVPEWGSKGR